MSYSWLILANWRGPIEEGGRDCEGATGEGAAGRAVEVTGVGAGGGGGRCGGTYTILAGGHGGYMYTVHTYQLLQYGITGGCSNCGGSLTSAWGFADRLRRCVLGVCRERLLTEPVESKSTRLALLRCLAVSHGTA